MNLPYEYKIARICYSLASLILLSRVSYRLLVEQRVNSSGLIATALIVVIVGALWVLSMIWVSNREHLLVLEDCTFNMTFQMSEDDLQTFRDDLTTGKVKVLFAEMMIHEKKKQEERAWLSFMGEWLDTRGTMSADNESATICMVPPGLFWFRNMKPKAKKNSAIMRHLLPGKEYIVELIGLPGVSRGDRRAPLIPMEMKLKIHGELYTVSTFTVLDNGWYSAEMNLRQ